MTAEQNYSLLQEIEENRIFILTAYLQNPKLLEQAEERIKQLFQSSEELEKEGGGVTERRDVKT